MSLMPEYPTDTESMLKVSKAHDALELAISSYITERDEMLDQIARKHNPFIYAAQSVLYEAMGNASMNGFTRSEMAQVMDCDEH